MRTLKKKMEMGVEGATKDPTEVSFIVVPSRLGEPLVPIHPLIRERVFSGASSHWDARKNALTPSRKRYMKTHCHVRPFLGGHPGNWVASGIFGGGPLGIWRNL